MAPARHEYLAPHGRLTKLATKCEGRSGIRGCAQAHWGGIHEAKSWHMTFDVPIFLVENVSPDECRRTFFAVEGRGGIETESYLVTRCDPETYRRCR